MNTIHKFGLVISGLIAAGIVYYGQYYDHGFNIGDEGSVLLIVTRILEGERLFVDISQGYGPLWYYPLVAIFSFSGVDFLALRIYFLGLGLITAVLAFVLVRQQAGSMLLASIAAMILVLVPGTIHKTYIPLLVIINMLTLTNIDLTKIQLPVRSVGIATIVAVLSFFIRAEIGLGAFLILLCLVLMHCLNQYSGWRHIFVKFCSQGLIVAMFALVPALAVFLLAYAQGFGQGLLDYVLSPITNLLRVFNHVSEGSFFGVSKEVASDVGKTLARVELSAFFSADTSKLWVILVYFPLVTAVLVGIIESVNHWFNKNRVPHSRVAQSNFVILVLLAFSAFPQFFLYRPDVPHLSQFMPGYIVLVFCWLGRWVWPGKGQNPSHDAQPLKHVSPGLVLVALALCLHIAAYLWFGLQHAGAGSIAMKQHRTERFTAASGLDVFVTPYEKTLYEGASSVINLQAGENEYVLCLPYCPGFNAMTNRPTFARKMYVDDTMLLKDPGWQSRMSQKIINKQPPVIMIADWALNGTEISRFHNWATEVMAVINRNYVLQAKLQTFSFYVLAEQEN